MIDASTHPFSGWKMRIDSGTSFALSLGNSQGMIMKRFYLAALLGLGTLIATARADFSPFKLGNTWTYHRLAFPRNPTDTAYQESLSLKVVGRAASGDTLLYRVRVTDSLYRRSNERYPRAFLRDSVIREEWRYAEIAGLIFRMRTDSSGSRVLDSNDIYFHRHTAPSGYTMGTVQGKDLIASGYWTHSQDNQSNVNASAWRLDDVGLYWYREDDCGSGTNCCGTRSDMQLTHFNGKTIDAGFKTPPLRFPECSIRAHKAKAGFSLPAWHGRMLNLLGRLLP